MGYFYGIMLREFNPPAVITMLPVEPVRPGNHHVTILYIGDRRPSGDADAKVGRVVDGFHCFTVTMGQLILLPSELRPRVLAVELRNVDRLVKLRSLILSELRSLGVGISDEYVSNFRPHVTLAYVRSKVNPQHLVDSIRDSGIEEELMGRVIMVNEVSLIRAQGDVYTVITRHGLQCP